MDADGEIFFHRASDAMFSIPNFVDQELIERCGTEPAPAGEHELHARLKVLKRARGFERTLEAETFRLGKIMDNVYRQVRAESPEEWGKASTMQVARIIHPAPNVPLVTLFAAHRQLMERPEEYVCHPTRHRFLHVFDVRPQAHVQNFRRVREWIRSRNPIIRHFQEKAKTLREGSRRIALESRHEPASWASSELTSNVRFTREEQELILFLKLSLGQRRRIQQTLHEPYVPAILKDIDKSCEVWEAHQTYTFLQDIGVYTPWEDLISKQKDLRVSELAEEHTPARKGHASNVPAAKITGLLTKDPHESVRHDFGDLPVYVIDDVSAEELDDGVSIEPVSGQLGTVWLHVHIADPTSVLPNTHPMVTTIEKRSETVYLEHKTYPMLPRDLTALSDLGRADARTVGQKVLTLSAKIDSSGEILDYNIRAGIVRNIHKLRYDVVNEVIGTPTTDYKIRPFEPSHTPPILNITDTTPHASDLKSIYLVTRNLVQNRLRGDYVSYNSNQPEVKFLDKPLLENPSDASQPYLYRGFPKMSYSVSTYKFNESGARSLVAECMKVAGRVASRICLDHNTPVIRLSLSKTVYASDEHRQRVLAERDEYGFVDPTTILRESVFLPPSESSLAPNAHEAVGARQGEGYMRATSPLRRAEDMFNHWQLKSILLPGSESKKAPLRNEDLERLIREMSSQKLALKKAYRTYARYWAHEYIRRYMESQKLRVEKEGKSDGIDPLREMEGYAMTRPQYNTYAWALYQDIYIPKLGLLATTRLPTHEGAELGQIVKVNALRVNHSDLNPVLEVEIQ